MPKNGSQILVDALLVDRNVDLISERLQLVDRSFGSQDLLLPNDALLQRGLRSLKGFTGQPF